MENIEKSRKFRNVFIIYLVVLTAFVVVRICSGYGLFAKLGSDEVIDVVSTTIIQILIMFAIPLILFKVFQKAKFKQVFSNFGFKKLKAKSLLICFGIGILVFVVNLFVASFFNVIIRYAGYSPEGIGSSYAYDTFPKFLLGVLTVAILPAFCEEFVHRGLLLRGTADTIGYKKAILISSLLFGLMHLNIQQFFYATILGIFMGFVVTMTRNIWPAIIIHFCNNFINVYLSYAESNGLFGGEFTTIINGIAQKSIILFFVVAIVLMALCVFAIWWLVKKLFAQNIENSYGTVFENIETEIRSTSNTEMSDKEVISTFENVVFPNMKSPKSSLDFMLADTKKPNKVKFKYQIPLVACIFMSSIITLFTFLWGSV